MDIATRMLLMDGGKFAPSSLFRANEQGVWYDPSDLTTLFQNAAGTIPVTAVEQPVGLMLDKSGRGNHAYQATSANRPTLSARVNLCNHTELNVAQLGFPKGTIPPTIAAATYAGVPIEAITFPAGVSTYPMSRRESSATGSWTQVNGVRYVISLEVALSRPLVENEALIIFQTGVQGQNNGIVITAATNNPTVLQRYTSYHTADRDGGMGTYVFVGDDPLTAPVTVYITKFDVRHTNHGTDLPPYQRVTTDTDYDTVGFPPYLAFNGTSSSMVTNSIDFSATDKMSVWAGVRKLSDATTRSLFVFGTSGTAAGSFEWLFPPNPSSIRLECAYVGDSGVAGNYMQVDTEQAPASSVIHTSIVSSLQPYLGGVNIRYNGELKPSVQQNNMETSGNFGNFALTIGKRPTGVLFLGNIYSLIARGAIARGAQSTDKQVSNAESWINKKIGKVY